MSFYFVFFCLYVRSSQDKSREDIQMDGDPDSRSPDENQPSLCLKQVYPKYTKQFNHLRLVERIASLFIRFLGVKGNMRLGPTAFRTFIRCIFFKLRRSKFYIYLFFYGEKRLFLGIKTHCVYILIILMNTI